jgi:hypothetical protein
MILANIRNGEKDLTVTIPCQREALEEDLTSIGIWNPQGDIFLRDEAGEDVSAQLMTTERAYGFEHRLIALFDRDTSLREVNTLCELAIALPDPLRKRLDAEMRTGNVTCRTELIDSLKTIQKTVCEDFLCPLVVRQIDGETDDLADADKRLLLQYEDEIREALHREMHDGENMADYYNGAGHGKVKSILWDVEEDNGELFGCIHVYAFEPFTLAEKEELIDWITGQNSDGLGEGFEQRPIDTDDGEIFVSLWNSNGGYFVKSREDFEQDIHKDIQPGGQTMKMM